MVEIFGMWCSWLDLTVVKDDITRDLLVNVLHVVPIDAILKIQLVYWAAALYPVEFFPRNGLERWGMTNHLAVDQLVSIRVVSGMEFRLCLSASHLVLGLVVVTSSITSLDCGCRALVIVTHSNVLKQLFGLLDLGINIDIFNITGYSIVLN